MRYWWLLLGACGRIGIDSNVDDGCIVELSFRGVACALRDDRTVWCWGANPAGQLGNNSTIASEVPVQVLGLTDVVQIATGEDTACARTVDGDVWCWGKNTVGQVGDGTTLDRLKPVQVAIPKAVDVAVGQAHACAATADGAVWCWGDNTYGELGDGTFAVRVGPVQAIATGTQQLAISDYVTCAILADRTVSCWGRGTDGALGDMTFVDRATPGMVHRLADMATIAGGCHRHFCGATADGSTWCWGLNDKGQLGNGTTSNPGPPEPTGVVGLVGDTVDVAPGAWHSCALSRTGAAHCWGQNDDGELGDGSLTSSLKPTEVVGLNDAISIEAGCSGSCVIRADHTVWCWGPRTGDGTTEIRTSPVRALVPCP